MVGWPKWACARKPKTSPTAAAASYAKTSYSYPKFSFLRYLNDIVIINNKYKLVKSNKLE